MRCNRLQSFFFYVFESDFHSLMKVMWETLQQRPKTEVPNQDLFSGLGFLYPGPFNVSLVLWLRTTSTDSS